MEHDWEVLYRHHDRIYGHAVCRQCGEKRSGQVRVIMLGEQEMAATVGDSWKSGECVRQEAMITQ